MGKIVVTLKVYPEDIVIPLSNLKEGIKRTLPEFASIYKIEEDPIAYGLVALRVHILMPDSGGVDDVENAIKSVEGISSIETLLVRRI